MQGFVPLRIIVPINGCATDDEAVRLACRLARRAHAKVNVVTVLEIKRSLALGTVQEPDTQRAETVLDRAETVAKELDVAVEAELLQAREAGPAIIVEITISSSDRSSTTRMPTISPIFGIAF